MELNVQHYLRTGGTLAGLAETYAVKAVPHHRYPQLFLLKYSQIESPMGAPIVQECRGLVLDAGDNWRVVGRGFDKFFNHGEGHAADIEWSSARVQEKADGSLIMAYEYDNQWQIATSGSPAASGEVFGHGFTFAQLFAEAYAAQVQSAAVESGKTGNAPSSTLPPVTAINRDWCFLFELMTPYNRVVVPHKEKKVVLLDCRNRVTGQYLDRDALTMVARELGVPAIREYPLNSFESILESFQTINGLDQEGYVVVDDRGHRVKMKHPQYLALHHLKDNMGPKWLVKTVVTGEVSEILSAFPEYEDDLRRVREKYDALVDNITADYARLQHISLQKDFALEALKTPYSAALFSIRAGKVENARQFLAGLPTDRAMKMLGVRDVEPAPVEDAE